MATSLALIALSPSRSYCLKMCFRPAVFFAYQFMVARRESVTTHMHTHYHKIMNDLHILASCLPDYLLFVLQTAQCSSGQAPTFSWCHNSSSRFPLQSPVAQYTSSPLFLRFCSIPKTWGSSHHSRETVYSFGRYFLIPYACALLLCSSSCSLSLSLSFLSFLSLFSLFSLFSTTCVKKVGKR